MSESPPLTWGQRRLRLALWGVVALAVPVVVYLRVTKPEEAPYSWTFVDRQAFADPSRSTPADLGAATPGQTVWVVVRVRNVGSASWDRGGASAVHLATTSPRDRASGLATLAWLSGNRPAGLAEAEVRPDAIGTFEFPIRVPDTGGPFDEEFDLVAEGRGWFERASPLRVTVRLAPPENSGDEPPRE